MFDRVLLPLLALPHRAVARAALGAGLSANAVTVIGCVIGLAGSLLAAFQCFTWALALLLVNRFLDGVDGAMARATRPTARGGFLDTVCDFFVYAAFPLAFAFADPAANALAAAALLAAFIGTGSTFLAFAAVNAAHGGGANPTYPNKAFFYLGGLTEGTETIVAFSAMCVWPRHFATIAFVFAAMCAVTVFTRLYAAMKTLPS